MTALARAVLDALREAPEAVEELRALLGPPASSRSAPADGWLNAKEAAVYLGLTPNALHKLTARRAIPFSQDGPNAKLYFRRADLEAWRGERSYDAR